MIGQKDVLIIDNGTFEIKAGVSSKSKPECQMRNIVGKHKQKRLTSTNKQQSDLCIGPDVKKQAGVLKQESPMENGKITNQSQMKEIWQKAAETLDVDLKGMRVLITDTPLNPDSQRREIQRIFLNEFECSEVLIASSSSLALQGVGMTNGLVLECGEGTTHALPVIEGFSVTNAVTRSTLAGHAVNEQLHQLLRMKGQDFSSSSEMEIVRDIKEKFAVLELDLDKFSRTSLFQKSIDDPTYVLPDGTSMDIRAERFLCSEVLFKPDLVNSEQPSVVEVVRKTLSKMDMQSRKVLMENVLVSGGTTSTLNFSSRLGAELATLNDSNTQPYKFYQTKDQKTAAYTGAKLIADLNTQTDLWIKEVFSEGTKIDNYI